MSRWRGPDVPKSIEKLDDGRTIIHLAADVYTITPGETGKITVAIETLEELLEAAGYTRLEETTP